MNESRLTSADPRLTAYAIGELAAAEVPTVEAALRADPALRAEVEEIRACAAAMEAALANEAAPEAAAPVKTWRMARPRGRWVVFPQFYYVAGGLAAAALAVVVALQRDEIAERERVRTESRRVAQARAASASMVVAFELAPVASDAASAAPIGATLPPAAFALTPDFGRADLAAVRRFLNARRLPPPELVRAAELVNAFSYRLPVPPSVGAAPVGTALEVNAAPWAPARRLVRIGFRGREVELAETRQAILDGVARAQATIAREVRIQVEFNPSRVAGYRLIGRNGEATVREAPVDELAAAGEMFSGQAFTALYEIVPTAPAGGARMEPSGLEAGAGDWLTVRLHYVEPKGGPRKTLEFSLADRGDRPAASADFQMATAVAEFAQILRTSRAGGAAALQEVLTRAASAAANPADDSDGLRAEFVGLVQRAQTLME